MPCRQRCSGPLQERFPHGEQQVDGEASARNDADSADSATRFRLPLLTVSRLAWPCCKPLPEREEKKIGLFFEATAT